MQQYRVTKHYKTGPLTGMTITETTCTRFTVGGEYFSSTGRGSYVVESCREVGR